MFKKLSFFSWWLANFSLGQASVECIYCIMEKKLFQIIILLTESLDGKLQCNLL